MSLKKHKFCRVEEKHCRFAFKMRKCKSSRIFVGDKHRFPATATKGKYTQQIQGNAEIAVKEDRIDKTATKLTFVFPQPRHGFRNPETIETGGIL